MATLTDYNYTNSNRWENNMATTRSQAARKGQVAANPTQGTAAFAGPNGKWADADVLDGADVRDKSELLEVPFLLTAVRESVNDKGIAITWAEGEDLHGKGFVINDTSTGVRAQLHDYLNGKGMTMSEEWQTIRLVAPRGLRISRFKVTDHTGRERDAATYYLTTSGARTHG